MNYVIHASSTYAPQQAPATYYRILVNTGSSR